MCDDLTSKDEAAYLAQNPMTRRRFNQTGIGAAASVMLPAVANAKTVTEQDVVIETPDGMADAYFVHPADGKHPAVIVWPDIKSIRNAFRSMGKRLAESGYAVLVVNPYYRTHKGAILPDGGSFGDPAIRERLMPHARSLSPETCVTDGKAFVKFLDAHDAVDSTKKIGTTGYCMTGSYTFRLAAAMPDRIGAGASFHGGGLATDKPDSPHLLVPKIKAGFLVAIAANDHERNPDEEPQLKRAFAAAGGRAEIEVYKDTLHGWCPPDGAAYNEAQAERAWRRLLVLLERELV
ncbi:MAG: dienelactone hydrolase family protein [Pseudomonadota bacterium]